MKKIKTITVVSAAAMFSALAAMNASAQTVHLDSSSVWGYALNKNNINEGIYRTQSAAKLADKYNFNYASGLGYKFSNGSADESVSVADMYGYNTLFYIGDIDVEDIESLSITGVLTSAVQIGSAADNNRIKLYFMDEEPSGLQAETLEEKNLRDSRDFEIQRIDTNSSDMYYSINVDNDSATVKIGSDANSAVEANVDDLIEEKFKLSGKTTTTLSKLKEKDENNDGKLSVYATGRYTASVNVSYEDGYAAIVGDKSYVDIDDAIDAVQETGGTVKLTKNCEMDKAHTISKDKQVEIIGNGFTVSISKTAPTNTPLFITNGSLNLNNVVIDGQGYTGTFAKGDFHLRSSVGTTATIMNIAGSVYEGLRFEVSAGSTFKIINCGSENSEFVVSWGQHSRVLTDATNGSGKLIITGSKVKQGNGVIKYTNANNALHYIDISGTGENCYDVCSTKDSNIKLGSDLKLNSIYLNNSKTIEFESGAEIPLNKIALTLENPTVGQQIVPSNYSAMFEITNIGWIINGEGKLENAPATPSAKLEAANWSYNGGDSAYQVYENTITDGNETVYGYKATLTALNEGTYSKAILTAIPTDQSLQQKVQEKSLWKITLEGNGSAVFYVLSNTALSDSSSIELN